MAAPALEKYAGRRTMQAELWLNLFEVVVCGKTDNERVAMLMGYLVHDALYWYAMDVAPRMGSITWAEVRHQLIARFGRPVPVPLVQAQRRVLELAECHNNKMSFVGTPPASMPPSPSPPINYHMDPPNLPPATSPLLQNNHSHDGGPMPPPSSTPNPHHPLTAGPPPHEMMDNDSHPVDVDFRQLTVHRRTPGQLQQTLCLTADAQLPPSISTSVGRFPQLFATEDADVGRIPDVAHRVRLEPGPAPAARRPFRHSQPDAEAIRAQDTKVPIRRSTSPPLNVVSTGSDGTPIDESSQQSTLPSASAASGEDPQCTTPKSRKNDMSHYNHPTTPQSTVPSLGVAGMNSMHEEYEISSPSWSRTPTCPVFKTHRPPQETYRSKKTDSHGNFYGMDDNPDRRRWLDKLLAFMEERRTPITTCPTVSKNPLDLFRLYMFVKRRVPWHQPTRHKLTATSSGPYVVLRSLGPTQYQLERFCVRTSLREGGMKPPLAPAPTCGEVRNAHSIRDLQPPAEEAACQADEPRTPPTRPR